MIPSSPRGFIYKPDIKPFPELTSNADFPKWYEETIAIARAQGFHEIFIAGYQPQLNSAQAMEDYDRKLAFGYMLLQKKVLTIGGKRIVQRYKYSWDAQSTMSDIIFDCQHSTHAVLKGRAILVKLTTMRLEPNSSKSATAFIVIFEELVEQYNDQQTDPGAKLSLVLTKTLLQASVSLVKPLQDVANREAERIATGGTLFTYDEYLSVIKSTASVYDEKLQRRSINNLLIEDGESDDDGDPEAGKNELAEYIINEMRRRTPGSSMNKETWKAISPTGQETWDKLDSGDKAKILGYAKQRMLKAKDTMEGNTHQITNGDDDGTQEPEEPEESQELEVNSALTEARGKAHSADPRRMLGSDSKPKMKVKTLDWDVSDIEEAVDRYWDDDSVTDFR